MSEKNLPAIPVEKGEIAPNDIEGLWWLANRFSNSGMVPKAYINSPEKVIVAWDMGLSLGLNRTAALQNIAVINGMPSVWGDAALGLVQNCDEFEDCIETFAGEMWAGDKINKNFKAICRIKLKNREDVVREFSIGEAILADLWGKDIWKKYPKRMLQMRARSWAIRDALPGALKGLKVAEEAMDYDVDLVKASDGTFIPESTEMTDDDLAEAIKARYDTDTPVDFIRYLIDTMHANDATAKDFLDYIENHGAELLAGYNANVVDADFQPPEEPETSEPEAVEPEAVEPEVVEPEVVEPEQEEVIADGWIAPGWAAENVDLINLACKFKASLKNVVDWIEIICDRQNLGPGDVVVYIEKHMDRAEKTFGEYIEENRRDASVAGEEVAEDTDVAKEEPDQEKAPMSPAAEVRMFNHMSAADLEVWVNENLDTVKVFSDESRQKLVDKWNRLVKKPFPGSQEEPKKAEPDREVNDNGPDLNEIEDRKKEKIRTRLVYLRKTYPNTCEEIREKHGFGQMVSSDDAARIWVDDVLDLLSKKKSEGKELN